MGLVVSVGRLADLRAHDPEGAEMLAEEPRAVNRVLASNGLPPHTDPEALPPVADRVPPGRSLWPRPRDRSGVSCRKGPG